MTEEAQAPEEIAVTPANFMNRAFLKSIEQERRAYPQHSNRASSAGVECARQLQWRRTKWSEAIMPPVAMLSRFQAGNEIEASVRRQLEKGGVTILQAQRSVEWKNLQLTGSIDGTVRCPDGVTAVVDIKSCSPFSFDVISKMTTAKELLEHHAAYVRGYPVQLMLYMFLLELPRGILFFCDKSSWKVHSIVIEIDDVRALNAAEVVIQRFERVNAAIAEKVDLPPEPGELCSDCAFRHICLTDREWQQKLIVPANPEDVIPLLERRAELHPLHLEYEKVDKAVKEATPKPGIYLFGPWQVAAKESLVTAYDIPEEIKRPYAIKRPQIKRKFVDLTSAAATGGEDEDETA